jgi:hypothetical protein
MQASNLLCKADLFLRIIYPNIDRNEAIQKFLSKIEVGSG